MFVPKSKFDQVVAERDALQQRLNAINGLFGEAAAEENFDPVSAIQSVIASASEKNPLHARVTELEQQVAERDNTIAALRQTALEKPAKVFASKEAATETEAAAEDDFSKIVATAKELINF